MALPSVVAVSVLGHATGGSLVASMPAGYTANDILVLCVEAPNGTTTVLSDAQGFVEVAGSPVATGGANGASGECQLSVFWKRAASGADTAPTISGHTNHLACAIVAVRGCPTAVAPFEAVTTTTQTTAGTALSWPVTTTTGVERLVCNIMAHGRDNLGAQVTSEANASLSILTEQFDDATTDGHGGGLCVVTGSLAVAGPVDATTGTLAGASMQAYMTMAFLPAVISVWPLNLARACFIASQVTFVGSATWAVNKAASLARAFQATFVNPNAPQPVITSKPAATRRHRRLLGFRTRLRR